jgi:A/G-specific adenine glycosylase
MHAYPAPKPRKQLPLRAVQFLLVRQPQGALLLQQRPPTGIWGGLWTPPELEMGVDPVDWCREHLNASVRQLEMLRRRRHTFSHFQLDIQPVHVQLAIDVDAVGEGSGSAWIDPSQPGNLGLPAPIRTLLAELAPG